MEASEVIPLDPLPIETQEQRLWVGNLDPRLNEYQLIKILQRFGQIEKFDLLFHRSGPLEGQPRGYAFVTYKKVEDALDAKTKLHGKKLGTKQVAVKWAHTINKEDYDKSKIKPDIPALAGAKKKSGTSNTNTTIEAIEAKLRLMEKAPSPEPDFSERPTLAVQSPAWKPKASTTRPSHRNYRDRHSHRKPYHSQSSSRSKWR